MSGNPSTPTHRRHHPRHDYSQPCIYHITLVCSDRGQVLGRIVGDTLEQARCELTPLGVAVSECIRYIEVHGAKQGHNLQVIAKAVMPDHVHFILYVKERLIGCRLGDIIRGFKQGCNKALRDAIEEQGRAAGAVRARDEAVGARDEAVGARDEAVRTHDMGADKNGEQDKLPHTIQTSPASQDTLHTASQGTLHTGGQATLHTGGQGTLHTASQGTLHTGGQGTLHTGGLGTLHTGGQDTLHTGGLGTLHTGGQGTFPSGGQSSSSMHEGVPHPDTSHGYRQPPLPICSPRMLRDHALFEADFDETILRRKGQLQTMIRYVHNNPKHRWQKQQHPDLLIPMRGIMIAGRMYDAIGNLTLLGMARHQVWVRSRWDEVTRRNYQNNCILKARQYHALVSPFISPHEAAVRDVALREGHSVIVLVDNGFSDYTQCPGGLYDYCIKGQVLVIVPSELPHISNKMTISRQECVMLNERAAEIANE